MINVVLVDDEANNRDYLALLLSSMFPDIAIAGTATSALEAIKMINKLQPHLVFMDIEMPGGSGFECLEGLANIHFEIIFVTAYDHYAIDAIKFSALDYLLKPVNKDELAVAVQKARGRLSQREENTRLKNLLENNLSVARNRIALASVDKIEFVPVEEIIRCRGENNYTRFYLAGGRDIMTSQTLGEYESILKPHGFMRIHQSHVVNVRRIQSFIKKDGGYLVMEDQSVVPVSKSKKDLLMSTFLGRN